MLNRIRIGARDSICGSKIQNGGVEENFKFSSSRCGWSLVKAENKGVRWW